MIGLDIIEDFQLPHFQRILKEQDHHFAANMYLNSAGSPQQTPNSTPTVLPVHTNSSDGLPSAQLPAALLNSYGGGFPFEEETALAFLQTIDLGFDLNPKSNFGAEKLDPSFPDPIDSMSSVTQSMDESSMDGSHSGTESGRKLRSKSLVKKNSPNREKKFEPSFAVSDKPQTSKIGKRTRKFTRSTKGVDENQFQVDVLPVLPGILDRLDSKNEAEPIRSVPDVMQHLTNLFPEYAVRFNEDFVLHARTGKSYGIETGRKGIDTKGLRPLPCEPKNTYIQLTDAQKWDIYNQKYRGMKDKDIAAIFGCHRSSVQRAKKGDFRQSGKKKSRGQRRAK